jgi:hypothetical protein
MKSFLDFNAIVGMEDIFKPTAGKQSLSEISNDHGLRRGHTKETDNCNATAISENLYKPVS